MNMRLAQSRVHFIGIGGIGMCGLAELLHNMGVHVKGSDMSENQQTLHLRQIGVRIEIGHKAENLNDVDVAVYSSAVKPTNVEYAAAKKNGIPLIPRAEALAEIMRLKRGIAVGGSHGKTTTTSMLATVLVYSRMDPTIVIGGRLDLIKSTAKLGQGEWLVAEADESDGSFHRLSPEIAVITNIDNDHLDHFGSMSSLEKAFYEFAMRVPFYGVAVVCGDDKRIRSVFKDFPKRIYYYGFGQDNDFRLEGERGEYSVYHEGAKIGAMKLQIPGRHNALNALAAFVAARVAGVQTDKALRGLESYTGVDRRFQKKAMVHGIDFYDDYGHHPTEVRAVLAAFKEQFPERNLHVLFQPHRYSRTEQCWTDFTECFGDADHVGLLDIYPAGEQPIPKITAKNLCEDIKHKNRMYFRSKEEAKDHFSKSLKNGDIFLTLGAGDVWKLGEEIFLKARK